MQYTLDELVDAAIETWDLTPETARDFVTLSAGQISDDPLLWDAETKSATAAGEALIAAQIEAAVMEDPYGDAAELRRVVDKTQAASDAYDDAKDERDATIRRILKRRSVSFIVDNTGFHRTRIYQIRDGKIRERKAA